MNNWIPDSLSLVGDTIELLPLCSEHFPELGQVAKDRRIWEFYILDGSDTARFAEVCSEAITERERGAQYPFVIYHKCDRRIIGSTRLMDIQPRHKKLEIGWTWLHPDYWAGAVNPECKLLLLTFCFEHLHSVRVQFRTDENNTRSRKAIENIGGQYEGLFRNDMIRDNGSHRHSVCYSIISSEWSSAKERIAELCRSRGAVGKG